MSRFIVTIGDNADIDMVASRLEATGATVLQKMRMIGVISVEFDGLAECLKVKGVMAVAPDAKMRAI